MSRNNNNNHKKYCLMLCELHFIGRHGKTQDSDPNIETHYLVYDRYDPITGISFYDLDEYQEYDTDNEYESDDDNSNNITISKINDDIIYLNEFYTNIIDYDPYGYGNHPTIRNYHNIVTKPNYIKPEIGEYIILPTLEAIAILKTFWIRIIQKKWKEIFKQRKNIIQQRCYLSNLSIREITGRWPDICLNLPGLKGMLSNLKSK